MKLKQLIDRCIDWGAGIPATSWQLSALFALTVILRNLLEAIPDGIIFASPAFILHFPVAYIFPLLALVFFMHLFSGYSTYKLLRIMVLAWTLTLIPPIIDGILGTETSIGYFPLEKTNASWFLLNFFNPFVTLSGTTAGIRIEAALGCLLAGVFTWAVSPGRKIIRGVLNTLVFAPVFLSFFTWPYLIAILFQGLFPNSGATYTMLEFHAATEEPLTGAIHYTTFLIDMIPVSLLAAWYLKTLSPSAWEKLVSSGKKLLPLVLSATTGTIAALFIIPRSGVTFADGVTISGALLASVWLVSSSSLSGSFRGVATGVAFAIAWASGWPTLVASMAAAAVSGIPVPEKLRIPLFGSSLFLVAVSPVGYSAFSLSSFLIVVSVALAASLSYRKTPLLSVFILPVILAWISPPVSEQTALLRGLERSKDTFSRSGRITIARSLASSYAASGGNWLTLAETTHMSGMNNRSRYICETAMARGDSTTALMKVCMNLAFLRNDTMEFNSSYDIYMEKANSVEIGAAMTMRVSLMAMTGDTSALYDIHSRAGMNPMLLRALASAHLANGDSLVSLQHYLAYLQSPSSAPDDWSQVITLAAVTGTSNYDSLYMEAVKIYGICPPIMLARLRAPVLHGEHPDRKELLDICLLLEPGNPEVLETAAMWYSAAEKPDSALIYASRALAGNESPGRYLFSSVIRSALQCGNPLEARAAAQYAVSTFPDNLEFRAVLDGIDRALWDEPGNELVASVPWAAAISDSIRAVLCP